MTGPFLFEEFVSHPGHYYGYGSELDHFRARLSVLRELSFSRYASMIRRIAINIPRNLADLADVLDEFQRVLPLCLSRLSLLSELCFTGPMFEDAPNADHPPLSDHVRIKLNSCLRALLQYTPLPKLDSLVLRLPCAEDFSRLLDDGNVEVVPIPYTRVASGLQSLSLSICDNTGEGGERYYTKPASETQRLYPNENYAKQVFEFAQFSRDLCSLSITCTHVLDMNTVVPTTWKYLQAFDLSGVEIEFTRLKEIIASNLDSLEHVVFSLVRLSDGTWDDIFLQLLTVPLLNDFDVDSVGYASSSQFAASLLPEIDNPQEVGGHHFRDVYALGELRRAVNNRRISLGLRPDEYHRSLGLGPLKELGDIMSSIV